MRNEPPYILRSVDNALHLVTILQREGPVRLTDAAARLGVAESTAHRLLSTLVHRDFAVRDVDRRYRAGPMLTEAARSDAPIEGLRRVGMPRLRLLVDRLGESSNLMVRAGRVVRIVATVQSDHALRVGDRAGRELPAELASGGQALLAELSREQLAQLYADVEPPVDLRRLRRVLAGVRQRGYAVNKELTETGVTAVGMAVHDHEDTTVAAISVAMPTARYAASALGEIVPALTDCVTSTAEALRG